MSVFDLTGRLAIVTGGGGTEHGVGRRVALAVVADVTDPAQCEQLVQTTIAEFGTLDILVNNAARVAHVEPLDLTPEQWRETVDVNLNGTFFCCQAAARHMVEQGHGRVVNIASSSAIKSHEFRAPYAAAKAAVVSLTRTPAISWAARNVSVNCVAPGSVMLPDHDLTDIPDTEYARRQALQEAGSNPLQRPGTTNDVADAGVFLASEGAAGRTGETVMVRGAEWASAYS